MAGQQLARLTLDGQRVISEETLVPQMGRIRDVRQGPDGYIYLVTDDRDGKPTPILRMEPVARAPFAKRAPILTANLQARSDRPRATLGRNLFIVAAYSSNEARTRIQSEAKPSATIDRRGDDAMRLASMLLLVLGVSVATVSGQTQEAANREGEALYTERCAKCHESGVPRAANREALRRLPPDAIRLALTTGSMRTQAAELTPAQIEILARTAGNCSPDSGAASRQQRLPGRHLFLLRQCARPTALERVGRQPLPAPLSAGRDGATARQSGSTAETEVGVRIPGREPCFCAAHRRRRARVRRQRQQHGVLAEREQRLPVLGVQDRRACAHRRSLSGAAAAAAGPLDRVLRRSARERVRRGRAHRRAAVEAPRRDFLGATITGAPTLADGTLYVVTSSAEEVIWAPTRSTNAASSAAACPRLNAATGEVRWKSFTIPEEPKPVRKNKQGVQLWGPSGAGVWSSPAVDLKRGVVYITTGDSYSDPAASTSDAFMAFDVKTGKLLWSRQTTAGDAFTIDCGLPEAMRTNCPEANGPDFDFGSSPILAELPNGRRALIAGQKSGVVHAVDPDRGGAILWQTRVGKGTTLGGVQWGSAFDGRRVYVALSDVQPEPAQPGTARRAADSVRTADAAERAGRRRTVRAQSGNGTNRLDEAPSRLRRACRLQPCTVSSGHSDSRRRVFRRARRSPRAHTRATTAPSSGTLIPRRPYKTVNGVPANGGSLDGPGPVVVEGMLFVNSGYAFVGGRPGNVLLAFSVDGR